MDGGTGLDADLIDGKDVMETVLKNDGPGSGLNADTLDGTSLDYIESIPAGLIGIFETSCPSGWTDLSGTYGGRMLVFTPSGGTNGGSVGTALTNTQDRSVNATISGTTSVGSDGGGVNEHWSDSAYGSYIAKTSHTHTFGSASVGVSTSDLLGYVQFLACQKD